MKITNLHINVTRALAIASAFSIVLLSSRIFYTGKLTYFFLFWNLFLAWVPFFLSLKLLPTNLKPGIGIKTIMLFLLWLIFFPNAPYIITDLIHLKPRHGTPFWFDIIMITSFVWNGLLLGFASLINVQQIISNKWGTKTGWQVVIASLILSSYGIYLGRFLRWNTWDVLFNPLHLLNDILSGFINPFYHMRMWGVTMVFSLFLICGYVTFFAFINRSDQK